VGLREPTGEPVVRRVCPLKPQVGGKGASTLLVDVLG